MSAGVGAFGVNNLGEGRGDVVKVVLVDDRARLSRLERENRLLQVI
jgi:hypothetical protein